MMVRQLGLCSTERQWDPDEGDVDLMRRRVSGVIPSCTPTPSRSP